jgi:hypothetical protein
LDLLTNIPVLLQSLSSHTPNRIRGEYESTITIQSGVDVKFESGEVEAFDIEFGGTLFIQDEVVVNLINNEGYVYIQDEAMVTTLNNSASANQAEIERGAQITFVTGNVLAYVTDVTFDDVELTEYSEFETVQLSYDILPNYASNQNVTFITSDATVATVSESGLVTFLSMGEVTITVRSEDGNLSDAVSFSVGGVIAWDGSQVSVPVINENLIELRNAAQLKWVANEMTNGNDFLNKTIRLVKHINLNDKPWTPMGTMDVPFRGTLDGNSTSINNVLITNTVNGLAGLFAHNAGVIKDLDLNNINVFIEGNNQDLLIGSLAGHNTGSLTNIELASGLIDVEQDNNAVTHVGGIVGKNMSSNKTILDLTNYATIEGTSALNVVYVGGIFGYSEIGSSTVTLGSLTNYGIIRAVSSQHDALAGGIVGFFYTFYVANVTLEDLENFGYVYGDHFAGGIIGQHFTRQGYGDFKIINSSNHGYVYITKNTTHSFAGGLIGFSFSEEWSAMIVENSTNFGAVMGYQHTGGLVGYLLTANSPVSFTGGSGSNLRDLNGTIVSNTNIGGLFGTAVLTGQSVVSFKNYQINATIGSSEFVGGIVGSLDVKNLSTLTTELITINTSSLTGNQVGGLFAKVNVINDAILTLGVSLISNSVISGTVTSSMFAELIQLDNGTVIYPS